MPGETPAGTGRVVLVKKIVMKDGAADYRNYKDSKDNRLIGAT